MAEVGPAGILISDVAFIFNSLVVPRLQTCSNREKSPLKILPSFQHPTAGMKV